MRFAINFLMMIAIAYTVTAADSWEQGSTKNTKFEDIPDCEQTFAGVNLGCSLAEVKKVVQSGPFKMTWTNTKELDHVLEDLKVYYFKGNHRIKHMTTSNMVVLKDRVVQFTMVRAIPRGTAPEDVSKLYLAYVRQLGKVYAFRDTEEPTDEKTLTIAMFGDDNLNILLSMMVEDNQAYFEIMGTHVPLAIKLDELKAEKAAEALGSFK